MSQIKKTVKITTIFLSVLIAAVLSVTAYGSLYLPDLISTCSDEIRFNFLFSVKNDSVPASIQSEEESTNEATIRLLETIPVKKVILNRTDRRYVALGGDMIGITLKTEGILIVGTESFLSDGKTVSPAVDAGLKTGDVILKADDSELHSNSDLTGMIEKSEGNGIPIEYERNGEKYKTVLDPSKSDLTSKYKCGLWIRDCTNGIGTLTYTDIENGTIASLGHGIYDVDTKEILPAGGGEFRDASLLGIEKGGKGAAGELKGMLGEKLLGILRINCDSGIYGTLVSTPSDSRIVPVAMQDEIQCGPAQIITTVEEGKKRSYDIEIEKIDRSLSRKNKNMIIRITDEELLGKTGGIVQGMSGSPILQNDMLVGAVTHVFLNDPQKGYGIFADNMLEISDSLNEEPAA